MSGENDNNDEDDRDSPLGRDQRLLDDMLDFIYGRFDGVGSVTVIGILELTKLNLIEQFRRESMDDDEDDCDFEIEDQ